MNRTVKLFGLIGSAAVILAFVFLSIGGPSIRVGEAKTFSLGNERIRLEFDVAESVRNGRRSCERFFSR